MPGSVVAQATGPSAEDQDWFTVDVVAVGGGLSLFSGDIDTNPSSRFFKLAGNANLHLEARAEHVFEDWRLGLELAYDRVSGALGDDDVYSFSNNLLSLDLVGAYELPILEDGFLSVFAGAGPVLFLNPQYDFPPSAASDESFQEMGTRLRFGVKGGLAIQRRVRIGIRFIPTDFIDGYEGLIPSEAPFDYVSFISLNYRFNVAQ